ncbi:MAG: hypothetical protein C4527_23490 [Candidatus Omnitrophota bacterium]|jgi:hypothetical protein|nr:MAG: hypothetical protein C4527_23490 [Candidatus Omnitrophota bacterium]
MKTAPRRRRFSHIVLNSDRLSKLTIKKKRFYTLLLWIHCNHQFNKKQGLGFFMVAMIDRGAFDWYVECIVWLPAISLKQGLV